MAYIGKQPLVGNFVKLDAITTSATTTFNLTNGGVAYYPQSANNCLVSLNGILQAPTDSYTISGSTIIFSNALTTSDVIDFIIVLGDVLNIGTPSDNTVTAAKIVDATIGLGKLSATGTKSSSTFLRGDNTFAEAGGGKVLQVVTATDSTTRSTTSTSYVTASNTLTLSITPSSASNKILLMLSTSISANVYEGRVTIFKNSSNLLSGDDGFASQQGFGASNSTMTGVHYLDSPATTSAITYDCRFLTTSNSVTLNYGSVKASLTALEIKG